jgi:hypothetical protein
MNLQIARVYLQHSDPEYAKCTWRFVMDKMGESKSGNTRKRWDTAVKDTAFDTFRNLALIKTQAEHFLEALHSGTVSTNVFLRRIHNFALDMDWILKAIIPKRQWPKIEFKAKRAITWEEHQKVLAREKNPEYYAYYELLWHLGGGTRLNRIEKKGRTAPTALRPHCHHKLTRIYDDNSAKTRHCGT